MKKLVFRASRGKAYVQYYELSDPLFSWNGSKLDLKVYFVIYPQASQYLKDKLAKVCDSFQS